MNRTAEQKAEPTSKTNRRTNLHKQLHRMHRWLHTQARAAAVDALTLRGARISDLCLDFTCPGRDDIELVPAGAEIDVTTDNLVRAHSTAQPLSADFDSSHHDQPSAQFSAAAAIS